MAAMLCLSACAYLPSDGPLKGDVRSQYDHAEPAARPYLLVDVTPGTIATLRERAQPSIPSRFLDGGKAPDLVIGRGDGLTISIWEAGGDTLFSGPASSSSSSSSQSARGTTIAEQTVDGEGTVSIPYVGRMHVAGSTVSAMQAAVEKALAGKASRPQVLVNLSRNQSNTVTVIGEVTAGARVPLSINGERVLDVLAAAGGVRSAAFETSIQLTRHDVSVSLPMMQLLDDPTQNVYLQPGDSLVVTRRSNSFTAFGATGRTAQIGFDASHVSMIEAVAKAGGLLDLRADPRGVFLFRLETPAVAAALGPANAAIPQVSDSVPVIYRLDLSQAGSFFLAQGFEMRDHDILYVASAPTNELQKFLQLLGAISQPIFNGVLLDSVVH